MTRAEICIPRILAHEGGFVDHTADPGGATNKGITLRTFRRFIKPGGTVDDLRRLTTEQAVVVYKRRYWDAVLADLLPVGVDYTVADFAVNSGPRRAAQYLQRSIGGIAVDGKIGPQTIGAARAADPSELIRTICDKRIAYMKRIRNRDTGELLWDTFGDGWKRRVSGVRRDALGDL